MVRYDLFEMVCCQGYPFVEGGDRTFEVDTSRIKYGSGALREAGHDAKDLGMRRVALFTDKQLAKLEPPQIVASALRAAGLDVVLYDETSIEPTDESFRAAAAFAREGTFDGFVSVGGGSTIDTCKAANLYASYPDAFDAYVNAPLGRAKPVPGPSRRTSPVPRPREPAAKSPASRSSIFSNIAPRPGSSRGASVRRSR